MLPAAMMAAAPVTEQGQRIWATAIAKHQTLDRAIVYRYIQDFEPGFERNALPHRIDILWEYASSSGMPSVEERQRMDAAEDAIAPSVGQDGAAVLVYVETGEGLRRWSFYVRSEGEFMQRLNGALSLASPLPIQLEASSDPDWSLHDQFLNGLEAPLQEVPSE
ncbi:DUF695 domain-containing protein [Pseudoxanthomonas sp. SL93]|uniref:DUF695 domain-containing protein n=1 Tax=Pseudoxanthomonas sp. SL93 TaxID=2995142 RepID=UPI00226EC91B|nr:DUF695 domain-containing protein [Pseudoxanthomonas sp. SL93]WAC62676.1 DUF695 domain-containing protein [Pseudoxanthomonas sp. SL93]